MVRLLASDQLSTSPKLQAMLRYIVVATLDGRADQLKEYAIGVDVFDRPPTFDPRMDSIVRVQASRLRKQLTAYYRKAGASDPVRIDVPSGGYAAAFIRVASPAVTPDAQVRSVVPDTSDHGPEPDDGHGPDRAAIRPVATALWSAPRWLYALMVMGMLALAAVAIIVIIEREASNRIIFSPTGPTVFVSRYALIDGPGPAEALRDGLQYELIDRLSRFPDLAVLGIDTVIGADADSARRDPRGADFILSGSVQSDSRSISVTNQLVRASDNTVVWSRGYTSELSDAYDLLSLQSDIAGDVAAQLGQPYGVIQEKLDLGHSHLRRLSLQDYLCVLDSYAYAREKSAASHLAVRACLEQAVIRTPDYAPAWAKLSWIYGDEARFNFNRRMDAPPPFERAREAAERAVAAAPNSAIGHQYLSIALFALGDDDGARAAGEKALELNPNNSEILADFGQQLILMEGSDRGREMVEKAIALNPGYPPWYAGGLAYYYLMRGEAEPAMRYAQRFSSDGSPMAVYTLAAAYRMAGDAATADALLADLEAGMPGAVTNRADRMRYLRMARRLEPLIFGE